MAGSHTERVEKAYPNGFKAVHGVDLNIREGEFMVFVGRLAAQNPPLRMITEPWRYLRGDVYIGDKRVNELPT